jgi:hypothetical protein
MRILELEDFVPNNHSLLGLTTTITALVLSTTTKPRTTAQLSTLTRPTRAHLRTNNSLAYTTSTAHCYQRPRHLSKATETQKCVEIFTTRLVAVNMMYGVTDGNASITGRCHVFVFLKTALSRATHPAVTPSVSIVHHRASPRASIHDWLKRDVSRCFRWCKIG